MDNGYKDSVFNKYPSYKDYIEVNMDRDQPKAYKKGKISGRVTIEFLVGKDGYIISTKLLRSSGYTELDEHALNIIKNSPRFSAVRVHGRKVITGQVHQFHYPSLKELYEE